MRSVIALDEIGNFESGPDTLFEEYVSLLIRDMPVYFPADTLSPRNRCPACSRSADGGAFTKLGFDYQVCSNCRTFFASSVPNPSALERFKEEAPSSLFFSRRYLEFVNAKSEEKIKKKIEWILDAAVENNLKELRILDLGTKYRSFLELMEGESLVDDLRSYSSFIKLRDDFISATLLEQIPKESFSVVTGFDFIESVFDFEATMNQIHRILTRDGLFFFTTRCSSGFDVKVLGKESKSILPPNRINVFSVEGLTSFFTGGNRFEMIELSTPGFLDLEIVRNELAKNRSLDLPDFFRYLLEKRDQNTHKAFTFFLQRNLLSSYARGFVKKRQPPSAPPHLPTA